MYRLDNVFTQEEFFFIRDSISEIPEKEFQTDSALGRVLIHRVFVGDKIKNRVVEITHSASGQRLISSSWATLAIYSNKHGRPNLPPHFDGDDTDLIFSYQFESNTQWDVGVDLETFPLKDNSAIVFNPNRHIHWRPRKKFEDGEYVAMIFFRLLNPIERSDYSSMALDSNDPIFDEVNAFRDSI